MLGPLSGPTSSICFSWLQLFLCLCCLLLLLLCAALCCFQDGVIDGTARRGKQQA
jgi:hypothetical protein